MKNFSKNTRSWRNAEKCISDSSEELKSLQNCPEDLKKKGAKLLVSKSLPSSRWIKTLSCKSAKIFKSIGNTDRGGKDKLKPTESDMDVVNEVLNFDKIESSKNSKNENFHSFLKKKKET